MAKEIDAALMRRVTNMLCFQSEQETQDQLIQEGFLAEDAFLAMHAGKILLKDKGQNK